MNTYRALRNTAEEIGMTIEAATRLQEARGMGLETARTRAEMLKAGHAARVVTVDFGRAGIASRFINMFALFFNPGVQGWSTTWQILTGHRMKGMGAKARAKAAAGALWRLGLYASASALLYAYNRDDERYWALPAGIRSSHHVFYPPWESDIYYKIPRPQELGLLPLAIDDLYAWVNNEEPKAFDRLIEGIKNQIPNPVPSLWEPFMENRENWSGFFGRPIVPAGEIGIDPEYQAGERTSHLARAAARGVSKLPGARRVLPEGFMSPRKVDNVIRGLAPGLGSLALDFTDWASGQLGLTPEKTEAGITKMPILRGFLGERGFNSSAMMQAYDLWGEASAKLRTYNDLIKKGRDDEARAYKETNRDHWRAHRVLSPLMRRISEYRRRVGEVEWDRQMSGAEKRLEKKEQAARAERATQQKLGVLKQRDLGPPFNPVVRPGALAEAYRKMRDNR